MLAEAPTTSWALRQRACSSAPADERAAGDEGGLDAGAAHGPEQAGGDAPVAELHGLDHDAAGVVEPGEDALGERALGPELGVVVAGGDGVERDAEFFGELGDDPGVGGAVARDEDDPVGDGGEAGEEGLLALDAPELGPLGQRPPGREGQDQGIGDWAHRHGILVRAIRAARGTRSQLHTAHRQVSGVI